MLLLYLFDYADAGIFSDWSLNLHKNSRRIDSKVVLMYSLFLCMYHVITHFAAGMQLE